MSIPDKNRKTLIKCYALKSNHIYCKMELNSVQGIFLIDSGASNSCIDIERQDKFKLDRFKKSYSASGAGNEKFDAYKTKNDTPPYPPLGRKNGTVLDPSPCHNGQRYKSKKQKSGVGGYIYIYIYMRGVKKP